MIDNTHAITDIQITIGFITRQLYQPGEVQAIIHMKVQVQQRFLAVK
jgi:hypothetical protein